MKTYHVGLMKGSGNCYSLHQNGHQKNTLIVEMARDKDYLSPDLWLYLGNFEVTKREVRENRVQILQQVNERNKTEFLYCVVK